LSNASKTTALNTKQQSCSLRNVQTTQYRQFRMASIMPIYQQNTDFHCYLRKGKTYFTEPCL